MSRLLYLHSSVLPALETRWMYALGCWMKKAREIPVQKVRVERIGFHEGVAISQLDVCARAPRLFEKGPGVGVYNIGSLAAEMDTRRDSSDITERADITSRRALRRSQETDNPCYKEHLLSLRCLDSNQETRNTCEPYFINYKNCKIFWASVRADRKLKGMKPYLPPLEERNKIKADYLNSR